MLTSLLLKLTYVGAEWVLWLLLILSVTSIAFIVERCLYFYRTRIDGDELGNQLQELLRARNLQGAWQLVKDSHTQIIETGVVAAGLVAMRNGAHSCGEAMASAKARMRTSLDAHLAILATIGSNAPFIGLLGTVLGIIKAAHDLTADPAHNNPNAVMAGVFEALVATAVGLFVAIPAVVAFNVFQRTVRTRLAQVDSLAHLVLSNVPHDGRKADASVATPPASVAAPPRVG
jgi:biopolymer transport protein ExbB